MNRFSFKNMGGKMIEGNDRIRAEKCLADIKLILDQYDCEIQPQFMITGARIQTGYLIVAKPRKLVGGN